MQDSHDETPRCRVEYERWPQEIVDAVLLDKSFYAYRLGVDELAELLASLVDRPDEVVLVVALDFVQSVESRQPGIPFTTQHGSELVGAKTMPRPDGTVDVVVPAAVLASMTRKGDIKFNANGAPAGSPSRTKMMRRTLIHEAQHVVMAQRGSDWAAYEVLAIQSEAAKHHYGAAAKMCDEHRAEYGAVQLTTPEPPTVADVLSVLCHLGEELGAADARYQANSAAQDAVRELRDQVYLACMHFWTSTAYWTAQFRHGDTIADIPPEISTLKVWQRYVDGTWNEITQALTKLPVTDLTTAPEVLREAATGVAVAVEISLKQIGFRHLDGANGVEFYVDRHDFPSARE